MGIGNIKRFKIVIIILNFRTFDDIKSENAETDADESNADATPQEDIDRLIAAMKLALGEDVKDVRVSVRLTESSVCLVADDGDMDMNLERLLKAHQQIETRAPRILEINSSHDLIKGLAAKAKVDSGSIDDAARLLLDQARIIEGEPLPDPTAFAQRMSDIMTKGIGN